MRGLAGKIQELIPPEDTAVRSRLDYLIALVSREPLVDAAADALAEPHTHGIWVRSSPNPMPGEEHGAWWWPDGARYTGTADDARSVALGACWAERQGRVYEPRPLPPEERP